MAIDIICIYDCINNEIDEKLVFVHAPFKEDRTKIFVIYQGLSKHMRKNTLQTKREEI
jgi:hypothetical protein